MDRIVQPKWRPAPPVTVTCTLPAGVAPALAAALEELAQTLTKRTEGALPWRVEDTVARALVGVGRLRAALPPALDKDYPWCRDDGAV
jgi:hypothetical protein